MIGILMVVCGCTALGVLNAFNARTRVKQLRELERIIGYLTGEIRYRKEILGVACERVSQKCSRIFATWLQEISGKTKNMSEYTLKDIWKEASKKLYVSSCLKKSDMDYIYNLGQTLGYLDVQAQEQGLMILQQEVAEKCKALELETKNKVRVSLILGAISGILTVIVLV